MSRGVREPREDGLPNEWQLGRDGWYDRDEKLRGVGGRCDGCNEQLLQYVVGLLGEQAV